MKALQACFDISTDIPGNKVPVALCRNEIWVIFFSMQIADQASKEWVIDLRQAGLNKVKDGLTSLEEVNRVTIE